MEPIEYYTQAWTKGFIAGCLDVKGTYNGVPPIPILQVPPGVDPLVFYYDDGFKEGEKFALQTLAGNNKYKRD